MQVTIEQKKEVTAPSLRRREQGHIAINLERTTLKWGLGLICAVVVPCVALVAIVKVSQAQQLDKMGFVVYKSSAPGTADIIVYKDRSSAIINRTTTTTTEYTNDVVKSQSDSKRYEIKVVRPEAPTLHLTVGEPDYNCVMANYRGMSTNLPYFIRAEKK